MFFLNDHNRLCTTPAPKWWRLHILKDYNELWEIETGALQSILVLFYDYDIKVFT